MMLKKPPLEIEGTQPINASVIWLHGLGADGYDFAPVVDALNLPQVRFILPHAPEMPVSLNQGYVMPAWYDLYSTTANSVEDEAGIIHSQLFIHSLIQQENARGIPSERIVLAGFSQGGAIALYTALRYPHKLAGVLALSTYLPLKYKLHQEKNPANADLPIFMAHGVLDEVISLETCRLSLDVLHTEMTRPVTWRTYPMAHSVCTEEIADLRDFLTQVLP